MASFEIVLLSTLKCFYIAQDDKIGKVMVFTSNNLSIHGFFAFYILATAFLKKNLYETEEKEISNILY